jgi:hypothetical protein
MEYDKETFHHRKPLSKNSVKNDSNDDEYEGQKGSMPSLIVIGFDIQNEQALNDSRSKIGASSNTSLPCDSTEPS